jgi:hypothetical protein
MERWPLKQLNQSVAVHAFFIGQRQETGSLLATHLAQLLGQLL